MSNPPPDLKTEDLEPLTWRSATERLIESARLTANDARDLEINAASDRRASAFFERVGDGATGDVIRRVLGGGVVSGQVKFEREREKKRLEEEEDTDDDSDSTDTFELEEGGLI